MHRALPLTLTPTLTLNLTLTRCIALYRWSSQPGKKAQDMRIGMDKGHNDDVFCLAFNPVTDHVVAVGKKFIRFFGVKEGYS